MLTMFSTKIKTPTAKASSRWSNKIQHLRNWHFEHAQIQQ